MCRKACPARNFSAKTSLNPRSDKFTAWRQAKTVIMLTALFYGLHTSKIIQS